MNVNDPEIVPGPEQIDRDPPEPFVDLTGIDIRGRSVTGNIIGRRSFG
jgi:hypothetical protein